MVVNITSSGAAQKLAEVGVNNRTIVQPTTWYTCPANKKAKIKGNFVCTGLGAAADAAVKINSIEIAKWVAAGGVAGQRYNNTVNNGQDIEIALSAGDVLQTTQSTGTNAEFNCVIVITESPA